MDLSLYFPFVQFYLISMVLQFFRLEMGGEVGRELGRTQLKLELRLYLAFTFGRYPSARMKAQIIGWSCVMTRSPVDSLHSTISLHLPAASRCVSG